MVRLNPGASRGFFLSWTRRVSPQEEEPSAAEGTKVFDIYHS